MHFYNCTEYVKSGKGQRQIRQVRRELPSRLGTSSSPGQTEIFSSWHLRNPENRKQKSGTAKTEISVGGIPWKTGEPPPPVTWPVLGLITAYFKANLLLEKIHARDCSSLFNSIGLNWDSWYVQK